MSLLSIAFTLTRSLALLLAPSPTLSLSPSHFCHLRRRTPEHTAMWSGARLSALHLNAGVHLWPRFFFFWIKFFFPFPSRLVVLEKCYGLPNSRWHTSTCVWPPKVCSGTSSCSRDAGGRRWSSKQVRLVWSTRFVAAHLWSAICP